MPNIIMRIEPSKRLSEILGFPYWIERSFPFETLANILTKDDLRRLEAGEEIEKMLPVINGGQDGKPNSRK